jgi:hypothetical protein
VEGIFKLIHTVLKFIAYKANSVHAADIKVVGLYMEGLETPLGVVGWPKAGIANSQCKKIKLRLRYGLAAGGRIHVKI